LTGGDKPQYGNWLKADVGRKRLGEERNSKRGEGFGSFGSRGLGSRWGGRSRSDSDSWRKDGSISSGCKGGLGEKREGVLSPAKEREAVQGAGKARSLFKESDKSQVVTDVTGKEDTGTLVVFQNQNVLQTDREMDIEDVDGEAVERGTKGLSGSIVPVPVSEVGGISEKIEVKGKGGKYKKIV
jgi:hypothetical protein